MNVTFQFTEIQFISIVRLLIPVTELNLKLLISLYYTNQNKVLILRMKMINIRQIL